MVGVRGRTWVITVQGERVSISLGWSLREGLLKEVTTSGSRQGNGWGNSICKGPEVREEFGIHMGRSRTEVGQVSEALYGVWT